MEETLYTIDIHKDEDMYVGKMYSNVDGAMEFKQQTIESLLRDITNDLQLSLDIFSMRKAEFEESKGEL